jgi:hypothetical protein
MWKTSSVFPVDLPKSSFSYQIWWIKICKHRDAISICCEKNKNTPAPFHYQFTRQSFIGYELFMSFPLFFSTKFWKQKLNLGKNLTIPAVLTLRLRLQGLRALGGENLGEHLTFIGQRWTFARSLAGALSRGVLNVIVIDLVLCGELKVPNLLDLQGRLSIRWRKLGWTFYFHCTDMTL